MGENKYHDLDKQVSKEVREKLLSQGICEYPVKCDYCDEGGRVETDNNGPIGPCPICNGTKQYMVAV